MAPSENAARRRKWRIRPVLDEWARNPQLIALPFLALFLGLLGDQARDAGLCLTAQSLGHMALLAVLTLGGLLLVAFRRAG